jgi:hypothetical protein
MTGFENAQRFTGKIGACVALNLHQLVAKPTGARFSDAGSAKIIALGRGRSLRDQRCVHQRVNARSD